jgi:hypothetical protein
LCVDFLTLEKSKGFENILVVTDHFTRYAIAVPTKNQTAKTTAKILYDLFVVHYGFPTKIHSDQGANFESHLIKDLCNLAGIVKTRTTPYHPMGNGQCERFNRTLLNMLGTLPADKKSKWSDYVKEVTHYYNCSKNDSTGYSPYFLLFGHHPRLPVDIVYPNKHFGKVNDISYSEYVKQLRERLEYAHRLANDSSQTSHISNKKRYDKSIRGAVVGVGDQVLVRNIPTEEGKHKLADRWEEVPYVVLEQPDENIPVYKIKQTETGKTRVLHRNMLLPFSVSQEPKRDEREVTTQDTTKSPVSSKPSKESQPELEDSSEEDDSYWVVNPLHLPSDTEDFQNVIQPTVENVTQPDVEDVVREIPPPEPEDQTLRRSTRERRPPEWLRSGDYVSHSATTSSKLDIVDKMLELLLNPD